MGGRYRMVIATDFTKEEIQDISHYIIANIPYSVLQQIFPMTENYKKKSEVFTIMYRIIYSVQGYVRSEKTKEKIKKLLSGCEEEYKEIYNILMKLDDNIEYGKSELGDELKKIYSNFERNCKINNLIDVFLVFAEKHILRDIDRIAGINTDTIKGTEFIEQLGKTLKN